MPNCYGYIRRRSSAPTVEEQKANILERFDHLWESPPTLRYRCTVYDRQRLCYQFAERRAGQRLVELVAPGDHVIFGKFLHGFGGVEDLLVTKRRWADIDITMHFADQVVESSGEFADLLDDLLADIVHIRRASSTQEEVERRDMDLLIARLTRDNQSS